MLLVITKLGGTLALIKAATAVDEEEGSDGLDVRNRLVDVSTPELHARFHVPDQAGVLADHVMVWIKDEIDKDPTAPVGVYIIS